MAIKETESTVSVPTPWLDWNPFADERENNRKYMSRRVNTH